MEKDQQTTTELQLANAVLEHLAKYAPASGESISFLKTTLTQNGWKRLGNLYDFASTLESLGFTIRSERHGGQVHRYVEVL